MYRKTISCAAALATALASLAVVLSPARIASAAAEGVVTLTPTSGTGSTNFNMALPAGASCSGSGTSGYRWETFIVTRTVDVSTLTFLDGPSAVGGSFTSSLTNTAGDIVKQKFPSASPVGLISGVPQMNFSSLIGSGITAGEYKVGIACVNLGASTPGSVEGGHYWERVITVSDASTMAWQSGYKPAAPVLGTVTAGDQQLTIAFTQATADPAVNAYTVSYTPSGGSATTRSLTAGEISALTITLTGLTNATSYSVTLTSTNTTFTSNASTAATGTPAPPAPTSVTATPAVGAVTVGWVAPSSIDTPTGYTINWTCSASCTTASGSTTSAAGTTSKSVTSLETGKSYTFTVTANYSGYNGPASGSQTAVPQSSQLVYQDVTVVRPTGALIITQRCGVNGLLPAVSADTTLGFPALTQLAASSDQTGTAPTDSNGNADSNFGDYPSPTSPTYPTTCGVNMGTATLVGSGTNAGNYYYATGYLNQLAVADTRSTDSGWSISGTMGAFTITGTSTTFSGDALGWQPIITSDSASYSTGGSTYDQTVTAGATIAPFASSGLTATKALASAAAGAGLGLARIDARLKLLVPVSAPAGTYKGTLTFTII